MVCKSGSRCFYVDFIFITSFKSQQTSRKKHKDVSFVLQTISCVNTNYHTFPSRYIRSYETEESNKFHQYLLRAKIKPFMLSLQCVPDLCPEVNLWGVSSEKCKNIRSAYWKEVFSRVLFVSEVYPEGLKFVKRIRKWDWTPLAKWLAPVTRISMHVNVFVWPVSVVCMWCVQVHVYPLRKYVHG